MSEARVQDLPEASKVYDNDSFVLEQMDEAKRLTGQKLILYLMTAADRGGLWGVHIGPDRPAGTQNVWIDTSTTPPVLQIRDKSGNWSSVPVIANTTTEGDFRTWNLNVNHPVGSWWLSDDPTSPAQLFGGTWERLEGCFLLGADASHPAGSTGGAFEITQQSGQVGEHWHKAVVTDPYHEGPAIPEGNRLNYESYDWAPGEQVSYMPVIESNLVDGDGVSHPVQPMDITNPYRATYIWRRVR